MLRSYWRYWGERRCLGQVTQSWASLFSQLPKLVLQWTCLKSLQLLLAAWQQCHPAVSPMNACKQPLPFVTSLFAQIRTRLSDLFILGCQPLALAGKLPQTPMKDGGIVCAWRTAETSLKVEGQRGGSKTPPWHCIIWPKIASRSFFSHCHMTILIQASQ